MAARVQRHQIIKGMGRSMYLPKAPDVLIKKVASVSCNRLLLCWFFMSFEGANVLAIEANYRVVRKARPPFMGNIKGGNTLII